VRRRRRKKKRRRRGMLRRMAILGWLCLYVLVPWAASLQALDDKPRSHSHLSGGARRSHSYSSGGARRDQYKERALVDKPAEKPFAFKWWYPKKYFPTMFVAICSRRSAQARRALLRDMWSHADFGLGKFSTRFALCSADDNLTSALAEENKSFGDLLVLNCPEGYGNGFLTQKTLATMREYLDNHADRELFMKVDDDTYAAWSRLYPLLADAWANYSTSLYMGSMTSNTSTNGVDRDPSSQWYEPIGNWPNCSYPRFAAGLGYIIGGTLVRRIIDEGIPERHMLWNEDAAMGVWMDAARQRGANVTYFKLKAVGNSYPTLEGWQKELKWFYQGPLKKYMGVMLHHHLSAEAISCLRGVEQRAQKLFGNYSEPIDACFTEEDTEFRPIIWDKAATRWAQLGCEGPTGVAGMPDIVQFHRARRGGRL
jgi:hypothetical protein